MHSSLDRGSRPADDAQPWAIDEQLAYNDDQPSPAPDLLIPNASLNEAFFGASSQAPPGNHLVFPVAIPHLPSLARVSPRTGVRVGCPSMKSRIQFGIE